MDDSAALGRAIQEARTALGMTQEELAKATGLARATIQKMERGGSIRASSLSRVEEVLAPALPASRGRLVATATVENHGRVYGPVTEDDIRRAVTDALVAVTDVGAADIRAVTRRVIEDLQTRRLLPPPFEEAEVI
jgi:transcriptional regulator with XRE-family HTH domain